MSNVYYAILTLLDVFPWIFFQIGPFFKNNTPRPYKKLTLIITFVVLYKLLATYFHAVVLLTPLTTFFIQSSSSLLTIILALLLIPANKYKICFISLLTIPASSLTATISKYIIENHSFNTDYYLVMLYARIISTLIISFIYYKFWKKYFSQHIPYVVKKENELWYYAWRIPAILVLISINVYMLEVIEGHIHIYDLVVQGFLCFAILGICALFFDCLKYARENINQRIESEKLELLLNLQQKNSQEILTDFERIKKNNHDFRHHLATLNTYAQNKEYEAITYYIKDLMSTTNEYHPHFFCDNMAVNATLVSNYKKAEENHINIEYKISIPNKLNISDIDLSILFGNLIENAIDASLYLPNNKRHIMVKGRLYEDKVYLIFENNYRTDRIRPDKPYYSSKRDYVSTGIGLLTVSNIVDKYHGESDISYDNGIFTVKLLLNC